MKSPRDPLSLRRKFFPTRFAYRGLPEGVFWETYAKATVGTDLAVFSVNEGVFRGILGRLDRQ